jgi:hypothetical protein
MRTHRITSSRRSHSARRGIGSLIALMIAATTLLGIASLGAASPAFANTTKYELYCPGTKVGNIAMNGVLTTGTITPASRMSGQQFTITGYQTVLRMPFALVSAWAALGSKVFSGTATSTVDAVVGATPTSISSGTMTYSVSIPTTIPLSGLTIALPTSPMTVGPFTATGRKATITEASHLSLKVADPGGGTLVMNCVAYKNRSVATGIVTGAPSGPPISPLIAHG